MPASVLIAKMGFETASTPETRFERHNICVLEISGRTMGIREFNLYHGDFLIPGKASVSLRLEELKK